MATATPSATRRWGLAGPGRREPVEGRRTAGTARGRGMRRAVSWRPGHSRPHPRCASGGSSGLARAAFRPPGVHPLLRLGQELALAAVGGHAPCVPEREPLHLLHLVVVL